MAKGERSDKGRTNAQWRRSQEYFDNYDRIFGKKKSFFEELTERVEEAVETVNAPETPEPPRPEAEQKPSE